MSRKLDGTILIWTKGAERLFGWSEAEALGRQLHELLRSELPLGQGALQSVLLRNGEWSGEIKAYKRDGSVVWLAAHKVLYRDGGGRPQSVIEVHNDITALKEAQAALVRRAKARFGLSAAQMGVWRWDTRTGVVEWSETLEALLGMAAGSFEGTFEAVQRVIHPDDRQDLQQQIAAAFQNGPEYTVENRMLHANGKYLRMRGQGRVVLDEQKQPVGLIGVVWDNSERKQREEDQQFLLDLGTKLAESLDRGKLANTAVTEIAKYLGVSNVYIPDRCSGGSANASGGLSDGGSATATHPHTEGIRTHSCASGDRAFYCGKRCQRSAHCGRRRDNLHPYWTPRFHEHPLAPRWQVGSEHYGVSHSAAGVGGKRDHPLCAR